MGQTRSPAVLLNEKHLIKAGNYGLLLVVPGINKPPVYFESQVADMPKYIFCKLLHLHLKRSNLISSASQEVGWGKRHTHSNLNLLSAVLQDA